MIPVKYNDIVGSRVAGLEVDLQMWMDRLSIETRKFHIAQITIKIEIIRQSIEKLKSK